MPGQRYLANSIALKLPLGGGAALRYQVLHWVQYGARRWASRISSRLGGGLVGPGFYCFLSSNL